MSRCLITITSAGVDQTHIFCNSAGYATVCGLSIDDDVEAGRVSAVQQGTVDCQQCCSVWLAARKVSAKKIKGYTK